MEIGDPCTTSSSSTFAVLWRVHTPDGAALDFMREKKNKKKKERKRKARNSHGRYPTDDRSLSARCFTFIQVFQADVSGDVDAVSAF